MNITAKPIAWEKIQAVIDRMMETRGNESDLLLLAIGCYTGFRVSDWKGLTWGDFYDYDPNKGPVIPKKSITIREKKGMNVKGKKPRTVPIAPGLAKALWYCYEKNRPFLNVQIFKGTRGPAGKFLSDNSCRDRLKAVCRKWGLPEDTVTHSLRKSLTTHMYNSQGQNHLAMLRCQKMLGHSSPATTVKYLGIEETEINEFFATL